MDNFIPVNDLDRAIMAAVKSVSAMPDFYRQVCAGELWFAVKYHPEMEEGGGFELTNGSPVPFIALQDKDGPTSVPLFSSADRFDESLRKGNVPDKTFLAAAMPAKQVLELISQLGWHARLNMGCATGNIRLPPDLMRDLASGAVLQPHPLHTQEPAEFRVRIVPPAEFPTDLVQPVFELLRKHRQFRAAFVLTDVPDITPVGQPRKYHFGIVMDPEDEVLFHDLNMVLAAACGKQFAFELNLPEPATVREMFQVGAPFYTAIDYPPPGQRQGKNEG